MNKKIRKTEKFIQRFFVKELLAGSLSKKKENHQL